MEYVIYTDGSCLDNNPAGGPGGFAWVATYGDLKTEHSKGYFKTTNNRMEIMAVIDALSQIQERSVIKIHTDSQYTIDGATKWVFGWIKNGWKRQSEPGVYEDVKNADLFKRLHALTRFHKVEFIKVKAHSGIPDNERCDVLAKAAAAQPSEIDEGFTPSLPKQKSGSKPWFRYKRNAA
jgi:ribonuclease HI